MRSVLVGAMACALAVTTGAASPDYQCLSFTAADGVGISADLYASAQPRTQTVLVIAPGFAQHSRTRSMMAIAEALSPTSDVLMLDFRGNGQSRGSYWFGSKEYADLEPLLRWAKGRYGKVNLMGFSLGAYSSLRAAVLYPGSVDSLLLVSCPTSVEEIVWSGGAFLNPLMLMVRKERFKVPHQSDPWFRWGPVFAAKPNDADLAGKLDMPVHFLVGGKDSLVFEKLSRKVYERVRSPKTWKRVDEGYHAEAMFLQDPDAFVGWVKESLAR